MNAVGIDVSKGKSTVTIRRPGDVVLMPPRDIPHTKSAINELMILSILVDTFISKISLPMQPVPEIGSISVA